MISSSSKSQTARKCPQCGSTDVSRSQRTDFVEQIATLVNIYPYRCKHHTCKHRFQSYGRA